MNLLNCFVKTPHQDALIEKLLSYCGLHAVTSTAPVPVPPCEILADPMQRPSVYIVNGCADWTVIEVNSLMKMYELGAQLSAQLDTIFVQALYCSVVEYAYLLVYERGEKMREIETIGCKDIPDCNRGEALPFEEDTTVSYFDLDTIALFCQEWGIDISNLFEQPACTVIQDRGSAPMIRLDEPQNLAAILPS